MKLVVVNGHEINDHELVCPDCGQPMAIKYGHQFDQFFYGCTAKSVIGCKGTHGARRDGTPMGTPANQATRQARVQAHRAFDQLWKPIGAKTTRTKAYKWLAEKMGRVEVHMGEMSIEECEQVIRLVSPLLAKMNPGKD